MSRNLESSLKGSDFIFQSVQLMYYKCHKSKHHRDFCCLNCLHSFRTENKFKSHEKMWKIRIFVLMPTEKDNILEFN